MTTHAQSPLQSNALGEMLQQARIHVERLLILARKQAPHGTEADLVRFFLEAHGGGYFDERLPQQSSADTIVKEYALRHGRADLVFFHMDGSATVIEAKDGGKGYNHVVAGIGQCSLYAAQLLAKKGALKRVQRALLWSSAGTNADVDIEHACLLADVTPLPYQSMQDLMATEAATRKVFCADLLSDEGGANGRP